ncbi:hypothetical protein Cpir12675_004917 [Ceratocystis pirilliformis]|uniref:Uncharacterized protein n=1 Tax=Ceratocystis pirilliformis TaxID=259994 RepID=A0ABR3YU83_9PEZI
MSVETAAKRVKLDGPLIGTHNGHFHADEALAVHMLRMLPEYALSSLVRTRDPAVLATCDTVVDVGGEYDAAAKRFDHHQRSFTTTFPGRDTKLSSAGLVFLHFGRALVAQSLRNNGNENISADDPKVEMMWRRIYESFIEALDAHDNGISLYDPAVIASHKIEKRFSNGGFTLGAMVGRLNRNWNDPTPDDPTEAQALEDSHFLRASQRIGEEFEHELKYYTTAWLPARDVVQAAFEKRKEFDPQGRVLVFEGTSAPWKDHLYQLEDGKPSVLYVLYPEKPTHDAKWRVQCVPESADSFQSRKPLPAEWRGFRDEELSKITGIEGGVFVHAAGFIGGNLTFEGAKAMALKALEM